jgi:hypothetical protein
MLGSDYRYKRGLPFFHFKIKKRTRCNNKGIAVSTSIEKIGTAFFIAKKPRLLFIAKNRKLHF